MDAPSNAPPANPSVSWQRLRRARAEIAGRWPSPFRLQLVRRPSDVLYALLGAASRVLDVGSGDARRRERVAARFPGVTYVSVDPDPEAGADHAALDGVTGTCDVAVLFEVLEHLPPEDGLALLSAVRERVAPGGRVVVSVPSTHTPGRWFRDCTHVSPWAHDEVGAALTLAGFRVLSLHRTYAAPAVQRAVRRFVLGPIGHLFGLDYAHSVVAVAEPA